MVTRHKRSFSLYFPLVILLAVVGGCSHNDDEIIAAYQEIVSLYHDNCLDAFYDRIEPETQRLLDHTTRGLALTPELKSLKGRELFRAMWGKDKCAKIYPMWILVPGDVTRVEQHRDAATLTVKVDRDEVLPSIKDAVQVILVRHDGVWKLSAQSHVKRKLQLVYPTDESGNPDR